MENLLKTKVHTKEALVSERDKIFTDLHDHLGGKITNLMLLVEKLDQNDANTERFRGMVREISSVFRTGILSIMDQNSLEKDLVEGLNLIVIRRYSKLERDFRFIWNREAFPDNVPISDPGRVEVLYGIINEICNNDMKYGEGQSVWELIRAGENKFRLRFQSSSRYSRPQMDGGFGDKNLRKRAEALHAHLHTELKNSLYTLEISFKI